METNPNPSTSNFAWVIGGLVAVIVCCACVVIIAAGVIMYQGSRSAPTPAEDVPTPLPMPTEDSSSPIPVPTLNNPPTGSISTHTLDTLNQTLVPENDPYELACRLKGICDVARTVQGKSYKVGDKEQFWVNNQDTAAHHKIDATLLYITPHAYFWAEDGARVGGAGFAPGRARSGFGFPARLREGHAPVSGSGLGSGKGTLRFRVPGSFLVQLTVTMTVNDTSGCSGELRPRARRDRDAHV